MPWLKKGRTIVSPVTDQCYKIVSDRVARGGFGEVYRAVELDDHRDHGGEVAIKVGLDPGIWHGEAYFGRLLGGQRHVVPLYDAFPLGDGHGRARQMKYLLVFRWMQDGTVDDVLSVPDSGWSETQVLKQLSNILKVLVLLHQRGICHGDITPRNVFVDGKNLLLGDLGIAKQSLTEKRLRLEGRTPDVFLPTDAHPVFLTPADDVYQVGLIALSLLAGQVVTSKEVCGRALKALDVSDNMKGWIRDALKTRADRFQDSEEALACLKDAPIKPKRSPKTLKGQIVVFTGTLSLKREVAKRKAKRRGAIVQPKVNGQTTLVVTGLPNSLMIGEHRGTKLFDAHRRIRRGQQIAIIDAKRFERLLAGS